MTAAGGVPLPFNTIAVSDNQSQGTPGMRASLISREVIADSIELMTHAHDFDALVCIVGCDKTAPAALMALARIDKPAVVLYSGPMRAGRLDGRELTIQDVWEAVGAEERGLHPARGARRDRGAACPGPGTCAGQFTANTMAVALDCLGISLASATASCPPPRASAKADGGRARRRCRGAARRRGAGRARTFLDRRALLNAAAGIAATGGSTNGVLHLLAIAREAEVELTLDELGEIGERTPVLASLFPSGRHPPRPSTAPAARAALLRELVAGGLVDGSAPTVDGATLAEATADAPGARRRGALPARRAVQGDRRALRAARQPRAGGQPRQGLRHAAALPAGAGAGVRRARRRAPRPCARAPSPPGDVLVVRYEGPAGGPGCARC